MTTLAAIPFTEITHGLYALISIAVTIWVAKTLHSSGRAFLIDAFRGNETLADSVNRLLVVGFYLINCGYIALALKYGAQPTNTVESIEFLSTKIGLVLLVLGFMHFTNLAIFTKMRGRALLDHRPPPIPPTETIAMS